MFAEDPGTLRRPAPLEPWMKVKHPALTFIAIAAGAAASFGCSAIPKGMAAVDAVDVQGNHKIADSDIEEKMATTASPRFLEMFQGFIVDYELYDSSVLQRDLKRVERYYRARGYYEAKARAGRVNYKNDKHVEVAVQVEEGPPVLLRNVRMDGLEGLSQREEKAVMQAMKPFMRVGKPFEEEPFQKAEAAVKRALTDHGYAWAKVERVADVDLPGHYANTLFTVKHGPKAKFGRIHVAGLGKLPEGPVRQAIDIKPGDDYSTAVSDSAQQAVLALGTFSSVEVVPELKEPPPPDATVPLVIRVRRQKLKSVTLGGGIELDALRTEAHLHAGWEHRNLFGGFRHFTADFKPGLVLYPTRLSDFSAPTALLPEERLRLELRQPGFIEARTNGSIRAEVNTYPVLLSTKVDRKEPVIGYFESKGALGLDRTIWKFFGSPSYNIQYNQPFAYSGKLDPDLQPLLISYVEFFSNLDLRDDRLRPHKGVFLQGDIQVAGLGGDALDVRIQPEIRGYIPLGKKVTLAARTTVGFLLPMNYGSAARSASGGSSAGTDRAAWIRDLELIYLRGFYSGGPSSNRGYPLRGVGPHGKVPFYNPGLPSQALDADCLSNDPQKDPAFCHIALGGLSLWEASLEIRFPIAGAFSASTFCDASDVAPDQLTFRFNYPHLSCGLGLRYDTPIGPVRLDAGYRIPGMQVPKNIDPATEADPGTIYGIPVAVSFGIGEAF